MADLRAMSAREWGLLVTLSLVWGGSFFFFEVGLRELPPFTLVLGRVGIAAVVLLGVVWLSSHRVRLTRSLLRRYLLLGGINNALPFSLIALGQTQIPSGLASILNATTPLFTLIVAHFWTTDDRMSPNRVLGIALGMAGVAVLIGPDLLAGLDLYNLGQLSVLGAALCYGFASNYGRRFGDHPPLVNATGMLCGATVWMLPVAALTEQPWTLSPGLAGWGAVLAIAVVCTALAFMLYFRLLATAGATNISLVTLLVPVSAISLGWLFLGERLGLSAWAGMGLIFLGLASVDGRLLKRWSARRR